MGGILYFGECSEIFQEKSSKNPEEYPQTFREMSPNILGNIAKHSREYPQTFQGMSPNILGNVTKHSRGCQIVNKIPKQTLISDFGKKSYLRYLRDRY